ncbi:carbon-nitrogen hydrolase family protein [Aquifex sp.]
MKLYAVQIKPETPEENLRKVIRFLEKVEPNSLVLLPELWYSGFDVKNYLKDTPKVIKILKKISSKKKLLISGTFAEEIKGKIYNVAYLIYRGKVLGKRGKIKLFPLFREKEVFTPWRENKVFDTPFGRVGILICFELRFTELVLELRSKRPHIILVPAQWGYARREHLKVLSRARAIELQSYLVLADTWGEGSGTRFAGHSAIYSPWGEILAFSEKGDTLLEAEYDPGYVEEVRKKIPLE